MPEPKKKRKRRKGKPPMKSQGYQILKRMGIPQQTAAKMTGIHFTRISLILNLQSEPTKDESERLCQYFDLPESQILEFKEL
jgi:transcriptional regulator with XRE-family HTH domain